MMSAEGEMRLIYENRLEQGLEQGLELKAQEMARAMKADNKPVEEISKYTGLSIEEVMKL